MPATTAQPLYGELPKLTPRRKGAPIWRRPLSIPC